MFAESVKESGDISEDQRPETAIASQEQTDPLGKLIRKTTKSALSGAEADDSQPCAPGIDGLFCGSSTSS